MPDVHELGFYLVLAAPRALVGQHQLGNGQVFSRADVEQLFGILKWVLNIVECVEHRRSVHAHRHDETTADRQVFFFNDDIVRRVVSGEFHAVRVLSEGLAAVQNQVVLEAKRHFAFMEQTDALVERNGVQLALHRFNRHRVRRIAEQTEQHALVRTMAHTRQAERAVHLRTHAAGFRKQIMLL